MQFIMPPEQPFIVRRLGLFGGNSAIGLALYDASLQDRCKNCEGWPRSLDMYSVARSAKSCPAHEVLVK